MRNNSEILRLRKFAITMSIAFTVLGCLLWWRGHSVFQWFLIVAGLFIICGLLIPRVLIPVEWVWMKFAHVMGSVMTIVLVTITFFLIITPIGMIVRLTGKDSLRLKKQSNLSSYWIPVDPNGPSSRSHKPY